MNSSTKRVNTFGLSLLKDNLYHIGEQNLRKIHNNKAVHTWNLGITAGLEDSQNITPQHPQHLHRLGSVCT